MANKQVKYTYGGMNQDSSKSKHSFKYYYDAQHIRILSTDTQSTGSVTNEKGNALVVTIPSVSIDSDTKIISWDTSSLVYTSPEIDLLPSFSDSQKIIGTKPTRTGIILFTSDGSGMDCIWLIDDLLSNDYTLNLLYIRNLDFSINNPIQAVFNYENEKIEKIYWVDGNNQIRFLNIRHSIENKDLEELIDIDSNTINFVGNFDLSEPVIDNVVYGGNHTAGKIQYAYNLYRINGSQTTLSPLTDLVALEKGDGLGGGGVNEIVGATPIVRVSNIDPEYTHIKLYAVKYTSFNQTPDISLIADREISESNSITYFDDGEIIEALTLEEFVFLGSNPIIPRHIETKDNRLFSANIKENNFDVDLDCRAYSYLDGISTAHLLDELYPNAGVQPGPTGYEGTDGVWGTITTVPDDFDVPEKSDAVNPNYDEYRYQKDQTSGPILGGTGKYITYSLEPFAIPPNELNSSRVFKDREIYRVAIQFYNKLGQISFPKWIADFKAGSFNLETGNPNNLRVQFTDEFFVWLNDSSNFEREEDKPIGFKMLRADRGINDRTVLYQGTVSPMMFQVKGIPAQNVTSFETISNREAWQDNTSVKIPSWAMRNFDMTMPLQDDFLPVTEKSSGRILGANHLAWLNNRSGANANDPNSPDGGEIHTTGDDGSTISQTFMFTKLMQLHSPDILFDFGNIKNGLQLRVNGLLHRKEERIQTKETVFTSGAEKWGGKFEFFPTRTLLVDNGMENTFITPNGRSPRYIGPSGDDETTDVFQMYRSYETFYSNTDTTLYDIYGTPEITEEGQGTTSYNGDARYNYSNSLRSWLSDGATADGCDTCNHLVSMNSNAVKNLTFMLGDALDDTNDRIGLEDLYTATTTSSPDGQGVLSVDIIIPNVNIYLGNIYGGASFEDKKRNTYIQIGDYSDITSSTHFISSPGDTFISNHTFMRVGKDNIEAISSTIPQISEIVSYPVETTVDLRNRNDLSLFDWDNTFQPDFSEYHAYNRVYSQSPTLILNTEEGAIFKKIDEFDVRLYASKIKIPGESIDSWTDLLINESQDLDGKYGPINALVSYKDELITFQDEGICALSISPRIQVQGNDGLGIELGTGNVFYDYKYISTTSGSINKWGVLPTKKGIYYYDALNKAVGMVPGATENFLSDLKGLHTLFNTNHNFDDLSVDNPLLGKGALLGYDNYNNDVYITLLQDPGLLTVVYNELMQEFIDKKKYFPSGYLYKGNKCLLTAPDNVNMYEQFAGDYNNYFGELQSSFITLMVNPESDYNCVFNNVLFNSELYIEDIDQPAKTLTHIQASNEYQDSGRIPLEVGRSKNLQRKFREWKALIPRNKRERMRNPWIFLTLEYDNTTNGKLVLHDIIINYTKY